MHKKRLTRKRNKAYQKGYRFERRVKQYYEKLGYYVKRSYASKGAEDLIAIKANWLDVNEDGKIQILVPEVLLIQCKNLAVERKLKREDAEKLIALAEQTGGKPVLVVNRNHKLVITEVT